MFWALDLFSSAVFIATRNIFVTGSDLIHILSLIISFVFINSVHNFE